MEQSELLRYLVAALERLGLRYLVTGSVATTLYGWPRMTIDIDVVVDLPLNKIKLFCRAFPSEEYYLSEEAIREAITTRGQFNIIHPASGLKVDVIIPEESAFNQERFARAWRVWPDQDYSASFASPEDVIIKKLEFYGKGGSDKHLSDIAGVLAISGEKLDRKYIDGWVRKLGLEGDWRMVQERADGQRG